MKKIIKNNIMMIKYIAKFCPNYIFITILNSILSSIIPVFYILFTRYIVNSLADNVDFKFITVIILALLLFNICNSFFNIWVQQKIIPKNIQILNQKMQTEIFNKTLEMDLECYENAEFYTKFSMALQQSDSRALSVLNTFSAFIGSGFGIASLITLISSFEPTILIIIATNVGISFLINTKIINIQHKYYEAKIPFQREAGYAQRMFYLREYAKELRLFSRFPAVIKTKFDYAVDKLISLIDLYGRRLSKYLRVQGTSSAAFNSAIMLYLAYKVVSKFLSIGDFIALSSSSQQLAGQINQFINIFPQMYEHSIYIENFVEFLNYTSHINKSNNGSEDVKEPMIEFQNVSFIYPNTKKTVLKDINIKIAPGEKIAFVGRNGAGKSTLIKLIARLYDPTEGKIMLSDIEYQNYNTSSLRSNIGIVFQDYQSFAVSIAENILMRQIKNPEDDEELVNNALKYVGLYDKVHSLTDGIYTVLTREFSNSGAIFSGGEFQKLAIARVYAQNSNIIILDEPSSALDPFAENEIFNSVLDFAIDKTVILISHRLTNVKNVDRIFLIEDGLLLEEGSHDELMNKNGKYAMMYMIQANKYLTHNEIELAHA